MAAKNEAKRKAWEDALRALNLDPSYDEEFDGIEVKDGGLTYVVPLESDDDTFIALLLPNCWPLRTDAERELAYRVASDVSCEAKVAKAFLNPDGQNVSMSGEMFLPGIDALPQVLARLMEAVAFARQRFGERMTEARSPDEGIFGSRARKGGPKPN